MGGAKTCLHALHSSIFEMLQSVRAAERLLCVLIVNLANRNAAFGLRDASDRLLKANGPSAWVILRRARTAVFGKMLGVTNLWVVHENFEFL